MAEPVILALGSVNVDFQVRVDRAPEVGETLLAHDFLRLSGGKAANVAFLARRLGVPAQLLAQVGDDVLTESALAPLRAIGVDLSQVGTAEGETPGISMIAVPPDGKKMIVLAGNANLVWDEADAARSEAAVQRAPAGSLLVVDYEVPAAVVERAVAAARRPDLTVVLDPSPAGRVQERVLAQIGVVVPNPKEAETLTGTTVGDPQSAHRAGRRLLDQGTRAACVKLPDGGCVVVDRERAVHVASVPVEVTDTTGAGDAFAGALAVALLERRHLVDAACFAAAASHLAVTAYGSQPAYPDRAALGEMYGKLHRQIRAL